MLPLRVEDQAIGPDLLQLSAAIEVSSVSVTIADMMANDAPLSFANEAFLKTTGYSRDDIIGRNCRFLQGEDTDPEAVRAMHNAICAGESLKIDILNYRKDGTPFWNNLHLSPVYDARGVLSAYIGVQHDVTDERAAQEMETHRQRIEALGRMAGGLAHELNNMLQPMLTLPQLVADSLPEGAVEAREDLAVLEQSARDARDLVADMLAYTRVSKSGEEALPAQQAIEQALKIVERTLAGRVGVRFYTNTSDALKITRLSQGSLQQIFVNLALNAADAMGSKGHVDIVLEQHADGGALMRVRDTGSGMPPEVQARIFEPFFTTKPIGEGAGLGLHVVRDLVRHAGGEISVISEPGQGTTFLIHFPPATAVEPKE
ncbi:ATP-binding protein [Maricaulaceae bacterium NA33B04]|nr:ATP-binding protein [Maricaulaceae bacterium NA33B04]